MAPLDFNEDTAAKILRQVEFYFSDSNLPRDKFLLRTIESSDDGLVSLQVVCSFARMRSHLGLKEHGLEAVTGDITQGVAEVLRKSALLRLSEDGLRVGRLENLERPEVVQAEVDARTVAAGPLPYDTTLEMVESFFAAFGKVNSVRLPRSPVAKVFCGSALVEFATEEEAKKLVGSKPLHEEIGLELEVEPKVAFDERMKKLYAERDARLEQEAKLERERAEAEGEVLYPQGLIVAFYLSEIGQENAENQETGNSDANAAEVPAEGDAAGSAPDASKAEDVGSDAAAEVAAPAAVEAEGVVSNSAAEGTPAASKPEGVPSDSAAEGAPAASKPEGVPSDSAAEGAPAASKSEDGDKGSGDNGLAREDIKAFMEQFGVVRFVDFTRGATSGFVRFESPEEAQKARTAAIIAEEGGLILKGFLMTVESVDGDAEKEYWKKLREGQIRRRNFAGRGDHRGREGRGGHHSGFRGGRGGMREGFFGKDDRQGNGYQGKRNSHKRFRDNEDGNAGNGGSKKGPAAVVFE